ncbi:MAG: hypothetical protein U1E62_11720 [Alsobacter sp.]
MPSPDLSLDALLSDPLVQSLMKADKVDPATLRAKLGRIGAEIANHRGQDRGQAAIIGCLQARFAAARTPGRVSGGLR